MDCFRYNFDCARSLASLILPIKKSTVINVRDNKLRLWDYGDYSNIYRH